MARLRGEYLFELPGRGLWVNYEALGETIEASYRGLDVALTFPAKDDDFGLEPTYVAALSGAASEHGDAGAAAVAVVRVAVVGDAPFGSAEFAEAGIKERARALTDRWSDVAESFLNEFIRQVRGSLGHHWMGTTADRAERTWFATLWDTGTGERIPVSPRVVISGIAIEVEKGLTVGTATDLALATSQQTEPPLAAELLADAKFLAWIREPHDLRTAVLLAAIACEVAIKTKLTGRAHERAADLLDLVLKNPRDVTVAVATHLDKTAEAIVGRSLKREDRDLWKKANSLFSVRNSIAHGKEPQPLDEDMTDAVRAAASVYDWIADL